MSFKTWLDKRIFYSEPYTCSITYSETLQRFIVVGENGTIKEMDLRTPEEKDLQAAIDEVNEIAPYPNLTIQMML
jgi:hypothetical protein